MGDTASLNPYTYARNNPLTYTDPTGMYEVADLGGGGPGVGVAAGVSISLAWLIPNIDAENIGVPAPALPDVSIPGFCIWHCGLPSEPTPQVFTGGEISGIGSPHILYAGGTEPVVKGQNGEEIAVGALMEQGYTVKGRNVTVELENGERIRVDIWAERDGKAIAWEVKTGQERAVRPGQSNKYSELERNGGIPEASVQERRVLNLGSALPGRR